MENDLELCLSEFISNRVERIVYKAGQLPEYRDDMELLLGALRKRLEGVLNGLDAEAVITALRATNIPIYEYCYLSGIKDGVMLAKKLDSL